MAGVALGRLWDSHPRIAFPLHLASTSFIVGVGVYLWAQRTNWVTVLIVGIFAAIDVAALVMCIIAAAQDGWKGSG